MQELVKSQNLSLEGDKVQDLTLEAFLNETRFLRIKNKTILWVDIKAQ
jgi:hypothetical protein